MTHFSEEQIADFKEAFSLFDKDADGYMEADEVGSAVRALGGSITEAELQVLVTDVLKNNDGRVDFPDFLTLMARTVTSNDTEEEAATMLETLTMLDKDKTGVISTSLLRHIMTSMGEQLTSEEMDDLIKEADKDNTGQIDYKEFVKMMVS